MNENQQNGDVMPGIQHILNLQGFIETVEFVPSDKPKRFHDQLLIVTSGGSSRAYIYDTRGLAWRYTVLT